MLSPHEFATLMLVREAPDQLDMNRSELDALLERQLVMLEHRATGTPRVHLTTRGQRYLDALHWSDAPIRGEHPRLNQTPGSSGHGKKASDRSEAFRDAGGA